MPTLFTGRSNVPAATAVVGRREELARDDGNNDDEPKTPRLDDQTTAPSTRLHLSHITRTWRNRPDPQYPGLATPPAVAVSVLRSDSSRISRIPSSSSSSGRRRFEGPDPAELHLAALADSGRRRRERHERRHGERRRQGRYDGDEYRRGRDRDRSDDADDDGEESHPRNFLFCFPWVHSRRLRHQILKCFVSGLFMVAMLSVYLALSMTHRIGTSTFTIMLILMILFATIIFCHGLVRICMLLMGHNRRPDSRNGNDPERGGGGVYPYNRDMAEVLGPGGYAVPRRPIRVVLARDEEAAGVLDEGAAKLEPPAYGVWRESVRIDPNRFFWQRNEQQQQQQRSMASSSDSSSESGSRSGSGSGRSRSGSGSGSGSRPGSVASSVRPPSYASDDGVSYVVEARPRSIVPPLSDMATSAGTASSSYYGSTVGGSVSGVPSSDESAGRSGSAGTLWPNNRGAGAAAPR
ncbi:hypothetical protein UCREL1_4158 [Eutypa lata UCREL1]|uniref:Uncharacterized protein n=1 Tax=Eutypa lata (strain UCR-EL1) TaxID=1287681 RepID=M7SWY7_EUTLA|nr:hypothetical protein UCREL1_4158 [Eutypa lata UCREL1]